MSQAKLGHHVGRSQQWISLVEQRKLLPSRQLQAELGKALDVDPNALFNESAIKIERKQTWKVNE